MAWLQSMASRRQIALLLIVTILFPMLAGCTGLGGPPEPNARVESDRISINAGESVNFDARASTSPESTVITEYQWNFGDGQRSETVQGYTSHTFIEAGIYEISVTVVNDMGGDDTDTTRLVVNGFPIISLSMPTAIRTGDVVTLDASGSSVNCQPFGTLIGMWIVTMMVMRPTTTMQWVRFIDSHPMKVAIILAQ